MASAKSVRKRRIMIEGFVKKLRKVKEKIKQKDAEHKKAVVARNRLYRLTDKAKEKVDRLDRELLELDEDAQSLTDLIKEYRELKREDLQ